jgi:hypothetical protein
MIRSFCLPFAYTGEPPLASEESLARGLPRDHRYNHRKYFHGLLRLLRSHVKENSCDLISLTSLDAVSHLLY